MLLKAKLYTDSIYTYVQASCFCLLTVALLSASSTVQATVYYVDDDAASGGDGQSWATAFTSIQDAVDAAFDDGGGDVWVAEGTYTGTGENVVEMQEGVNLFGGYDSSQINQRDWEQNPTVIDGEEERRGVLGASGVTLDGFFIMYGNGGYIESRFGMNQVGGGMFNDGSSPVVRDCRFENNTLIDSDSNVCLGGGMYNSNASPTIVNCEFIENQILGSSICQGGGIYNVGSSPTIINCTFIDNLIRSSRLAAGAGMYDALYSSSQVTNCLFVENVAIGLFSFTSGHGGGVNIGLSSSHFMNCTFSMNAAGLGGGVYTQTSTAQFTNCIVWGNSTSVSIYDDSEFSYSCVEGGFAGEGNIDTDPRFRDVQNGDLRLTAMSPCIDAGTTEGAFHVDIRGFPRPHGEGVDMGAYEYSNISPAIEIIQVILGVVPGNENYDLNDDDLIDSVDLLDE